MTALSRDNRRPMIAKVHLGAKELGLSEDARRDLMFRVTARRSAADMTFNQLDAVLAEYRRLGWKPGQRQAAVAGRPVGRKSAAADHPVARKARALWISLHQLGVVRDTSEAALEAFARRQLQVERFQWADQGQGYKLIEALKAMAERAGWAQDTAGFRGRAAIDELKRRLAVLIAERQAQGAND